MSNANANANTNADADADAGVIAIALPVLSYRRAKNEWGYSTCMFMSGLTNNKRGVMVLLNNNFQHEVGRVIKDPNGNLLIMEITITGKKITYANIYGPNEDRPQQFYSMLRQKVEDLDNEMIIMCGDSGT